MKNLIPLTLVLAICTVSVFAMPQQLSINAVQKNSAAKTSGLKKCLGLVGTTIFSIAYLGVAINSFYHIPLQPTTQNLTTTPEKMDPYIWFAHKRSQVIDRCIDPCEQTVNFHYCPELCEEFADYDLLH